MPTDTTRAWICTLVVTGIAAVIRLWGIGFPKGTIFDEVYYATEANELLNHGYESNPGYMFIVHPPLGKWCIALGEWLFGHNEIGWRIPSAVAGTLCVLLLIRVTRRLTRSTLLGLIAGLLLTVDGLSFVQSRVALLDIFLALFVLAGFTCLVIDRDWVRDRLAVAEVDPDTYGPKLGPRPWRLAGGVLLGLACGVKWSGLYFLIGFAILCVWWDRSARRAAGVERSYSATAVRDLPGSVASLVIAPVVAYLATWTGWFLGENAYDRHWGDTHAGYWSWLGSPLRSLLKYHSETYQFHTHLSSSHPYQSTPWSWLVDGRPVSYFYDGEAGTGCGSSQCVRQVLGIGTPVLWWLFIPALLWMIWLLLTRRDWRAGAVLMAFGAGWLAWALLPGDRTMFLFYMTPLVPFLVIGVVLTLGDVLGRPGSSDTRRTWGLVAVCGVVAAVVVDFAWMHPILVANLISYDTWHARMWFPSWI